MKSSLPFLLIRGGGKEFHEINICVLTHLMKCGMFEVGGGKDGKDRCGTREIKY